MSIFELLATACSGLFAGGAVYISVVQQPAALRAGVAVALAYFPHMYRHAAPMQVALAIAGSIAGVVAWVQGSGLLWLAGALLLGSVIPFTLLRIQPVNDRLFAPGLDPAAPESRELLERWARLHAVRSVASTLAFLLFLCG
jgi:uncharacterized membrane protein